MMSRRKRNRDRRKKRKKNKRPQNKDSKQQGPKQQGPKQEAPKQEAPKQEAPKHEEPKHEEPKQDPPKQEPPKHKELKHKDAHTRKKSKMGWKKWTMLIVVALMLLSMVIYVASFDESEPEAPIDAIDPAAARQIEAGEEGGQEEHQPMPAAE